MSITIDGRPTRVEPAMATMIAALLEQQSTIARQMYGTILINFSPKVAKVSVWKKVAEVGD